MASASELTKKDPVTISLGQAHDQISTGHDIKSLDREVVKKEP